MGRPSNVPSDYEFLGWSTAKTGGTIFDQDDVNVTTSDFFPDIATKSGEVTLYARWELALPETLKLRNGWKYDLGLSDENYTYASNNTKVAIVSTSGVITAIGVGEATISVVDADSNSVQITVTVYPVMEGDINLDGKVTIADAVLLQKWLLAVPNTVLPDWKAGDMNGDGRLNVVDLTLLKRSLIYG